VRRSLGLLFGGILHPRGDQDGGTDSAAVIGSVAVLSTSSARLGLGVRASAVASQKPGSMPRPAS